jgi:hypothetical protein
MSAATSAIIASSDGARPVAIGWMVALTPPRLAVRPRFS